MINPQELRSIADFTEKCQELFDSMVRAKGLEVLFHDTKVGTFTISRSEGDFAPLGEVTIADSGDYEFVPDVPESTS